MNKSHKSVIIAMFEAAQVTLSELKRIPLQYFAIKEGAILPIVAPHIKEAKLPTIVWQVLQEKDAEAAFIITEARMVIDGDKNTDGIEVLNLFYIDAYGKDTVLVTGKIERDSVGTPYVREYKIEEEVDSFDTRLITPWKTKDFKEGKNIGA